jgi:hypothetical protein
LVFFLSLPHAGDPRRLVEQFHVDLADASPAVRVRIEPALVGLGYVAAGGRFVDERTPAGGHRLLGRTTGPHWMLLPVARRYCKRAQGIQS